MTSPETDSAGLTSSVLVLAKIVTRNLSEESALQTEDIKDQRRKVILTEVGPDLKTALDCAIDLLKSERGVRFEGEIAEGSGDGPLECEPVEEDVAEDVPSQMGRIQGAGDHLVDLMALGKGWAHLGLLEVHLLAPTGPVDPAEKKALKLQYVRNEVGLIRLLVLVNQVCPSHVGHQAGDYLWFRCHEFTENISIPPWMGCQSIAGYFPSCCLYQFILVRRSNYGRVSRTRI